MKDTLDLYLAIRSHVVESLVARGASAEEIFGIGVMSGWALTQHDECPDSEPERVMALALRSVALLEFGHDGVGDCCPDGHDGYIWRERNKVVICCQHPIQKYKADLMVWGKRNIVVEVDGHDFHERTKEQAQHDKARDRLFQKLGYQVFRYTGSEVWRDPIKCAEEVIKAAA